LSDLKEKFREEDNKTIKVAELKKVEQESKTVMERFGPNILFLFYLFFF